MTLWCWSLVLRLFASNTTIINRRKLVVAGAAGGTVAFTVVRSFSSTNVSSLEQQEARISPTKLLPSRQEQVARLSRAWCSIITYLNSLEAPTRNETSCRQPKDRSHVMRL